MKRDYTVLIAITTMFIGAIIVYFGRIYYPQNFHPETVTFFENYMIFVLGICLVVGIGSLILFGLWWVGKELIKDIKSLFKNKKLQHDISEVNDNSESPIDNSHGDLVPLIWLIEKLRRREGGCIMNELIAEAKKNFKGLEHIKHRTINYNNYHEIIKRRNV